MWNRTQAVRLQPRDGVLHPTSLPVGLLVSVESLVGLLFIALTAGLAFARFNRGVARIRFSTMATVPLHDGVPTLRIRLANERRDTILDTHLKLFLALDEISREGRMMRRLIPMALKRAEGSVFMLMWTAIHPIDAHSPLRGLGSEEQATARAEVVVAFSGIDETLERSIHARHHDPAARIVFGRRFVDMVERDGEGHILHFDRFDSIETPPD